MRRLARHRFTILSAISLLLLAAVCAVWARSYYVVERVGRVWYAPGIDKEDHHQYLFANWGVAELTVGGDPAENFPAVRWHWDRYPAYPTRLAGRAQQPWLRHIGIAWSPEQTLITGETTWSVRMHLALPASVLAAATLLFGWRAWRRTRTRPGHCNHCGYDLRASPERCPECGTVPAAKGVA